MQGARTKASLRKELLEKRDAIPPEVRRVKNRLIGEELLSLDEIKTARVVFIFASFKSEVDTSVVINHLFAEGKKVVLPVVDREHHILLLYEIRGLDELAPGCMEIREPTVRTGERLTVVSNVDAVVIPGAGFDPEGNRIGYGGGYYDILLSSLERPIPIIAPAFEEQIADSLPSEPHDIRVDTIVTDRRVIRVRPS
jgi:5-formyltetrahydrofolate cyclo-ligase